MSKLILALLLMSCTAQRSTCPPPRQVTSDDVSCAIGCAASNGEMVSQENDVCTCRFRLVPVQRKPEPDAGTVPQTEGNQT
jgi:hypothetical protein